MRINSIKFCWVGRGFLKGSGDREGPGRASKCLTSGAGRGKDFLMTTADPAPDRKPLSAGGGSRSCTFFLPAFRRYDPTFFQGKMTCGTLAVSVTGPECRLRCLHCGGRILETMRPAVTPEALLQEARAMRNQGRKSLLVSGGRGGTAPSPLSPFSRY